MSESHPVTVYSSGVVVSAGESSYAAVLEAGGNNSITATSGGVVAETSMGAGTLLVADSGAIVSGINVDDKGALLSGTEIVCSGATKWYGPAACATMGSIAMVGGTFTGNLASTLNGDVGMGGVFQVFGGALTANGGTYGGNSATGGGGAIYVAGSALISGAVFSGNRALYGGAVEAAHSGTTMTVTNAVFSGNSAEYGGAFEAHQGASVLISGAEFIGNEAISGGAAMVDAYKASKSYLTLVDATMSGNTAELGGAILNDGVLTVSGGEFAENEAEYGGALYNNNTGSATVTNAVISGNTAVYGGAVWQGKKKLTLDNSYIASNTAIYGGALYANISGSTIISAASFEGNVANYDEDYDLGGMGGAVYVAGAATVTITDAFFESNVAEVNPDNEWDGGCGGAVINYGNLTVTSGAFMGNSAYYGGALYNQVPYPAVGESDGTMTVVSADFTDNTAAWGGGAICNCYGTLTVSGGNYSGNKVTGKTGRDGGAIANWSDAEITGALFTENTAKKGGALSHTGTTLTVTDAVFGNNTAEEGGAFWNMNEYGASVATLVNCSFTDNMAEEGGAIWNGETLTVSGGELSGNEAEDGKGGALYNTGSASFSMANFIDNTALYGGAVWNGGDVEINDAYIASNTAIYGGALYANISGSTIISAVSFEGNRANYDEDYDLGGMGGAVYVAGAATVTVTDTIFEGNVAEVNPDNEWDGGCGGAVINYGNLTVTSGAFMGNSAYYGGALYNQAGAGTPMTVVNAAFTDNTAAWGGGAICNCWGELVVSGGNYSGNKVTGKDAMNVGGGAIANWSDATITGASFTSNTVVTGKGGAITNTGTTLTVTDAVFTGNTADEGGAIWNKTEYGGSPAVSLSNCTFTGNTAELGGALLNDGTAELVNCTFATATDTIRNDSVITVSGENTFAGAVVNSATGSFRVSLANSTVDSAAVVGGWSNLSGGAISIIAPTDLEYGTYRIASGVGAWSGDIALTVGAEDTGGKFTLAGGSVVPGVISYGYADYELAADSEGNMTLDIKAPAVQAQAGALGPDAARANGDRAGTWNSSTGVTSGAVILVPDDMPDGSQAYLVIDSGYDGGGTDDGTVLYGASGTSFEHGTVNILARGGSLRNLAAGAAATGKVAAVELTFQGTALTGVGYAGGFGSVTGATETLISDGTFAKDFYAGALANYKNTGVATTVGDVSLTVEDGTFSGNLYGASAVKASVAGAHTAGDVTVKLAGGTAEKSDFCCFAGGYATGNAADAAVYTVGKIGVDVTGGSWGEAHGGRGIFGGAFASGVKAAASDVTISVSGGTMGNVYGGGWAQKGGTSIVGSVNITISGDAQVVNVYGGGSHSISAGSENSTTQAANVTITVSGGSVTGGIYARGQLDGDVVTGSADVIFTGSKDYGCSVYGYTYVGGTASDATLRFTAYSGTLAGRIGGFAGVTFDGNTEMTLSAAKSAVSNTEWIFDVAARDAGMSGTAMLDWNAADFTGDNITLKLGATVSEWTLIDAASTTAYDKFGVDGIAEELALDEKIAGTGTACDGWGFTVEESTLKFKQLA